MNYLRFSDYNGGEDRLDSNDVLRMPTQLLQAADFIHEAGHVHGGTTTFL